MSASRMKPGRTCARQRPGPGHRLVSHGGQLIMRLAPGPCLLPGVLATIRALPAPAG